MLSTQGELAETRSLHQFFTPSSWPPHRHVTSPASPAETDWLELDEPGEPIPFSFDDLIDELEMVEPGSARTLRRGSFDHLAPGMRPPPLVRQTCGSH